MTTYAILDTFNNRVISRHRTVDAAVKANSRFQRAVKRNNGRESYIPVELRKVAGDELERLEEDSQEMEEWLYSEACQ